MRLGCYKIFLSKKNLKHLVKKQFHFKKYSSMKWHYIFFNKSASVTAISLENMQWRHFQIKWMIGEGSDLHCVNWYFSGAYQWLVDIMVFLLLGQLRQRKAAIFFWAFPKFRKPFRTRFLGQEKWQPCKCFSLQNNFGLALKYNRSTADGFRTAEVVRKWSISNC